MGWLIIVIVVCVVIYKWIRAKDERKVQERTVYSAPNDADALNDEEILLKDASNGNPAAMRSLAFAYLRDDGRFGYDEKKAVMWFERLADKGDIEAMRQLSFIYSPDNDEFSLKDASISFQWMQKAAECGDAHSMNDIAFEYQWGDHVTKDLDKAIMWFEKAANAGYAEAYYNLSVIYENPTDSKHYDPQKAFEMLLKAVHSGDNVVYSHAAFSLGFKYGAHWLVNAPMNELTDKRKAAYCFYVSSYANDNKTAMEHYDKLSYQASQEECWKWENDARSLQFNP